MKAGEPGEASPIYPLQPAIQHAPDRTQHQVDQPVEGGDGHRQSRPAHHSVGG